MQRVTVRPVQIVDSQQNRLPVGALEQADQSEQQIPGEGRDLLRRHDAADVPAGQGRQGHTADGVAGRVPRVAGELLGDEPHHGHGAVQREVVLGMTSLNCNTAKPRPIASFATSPRSALLPIPAPPCRMMQPPSPAAAASSASLQAASSYSRSYTANDPLYQATMRLTAVAPLFCSG